ncbi:MAG: hypothetical protein C0467_29475 [Planctomycetaceae bacterium]|nr:hypothetical protein [Planctomycetaceae bacterium]
MERDRKRVPSRLLIGLDRPPAQVPHQVYDPRLEPVTKHHLSSPSQPRCFIAVPGVQLFRE